MKEYGYYARTDVSLIKRFRQETRENEQIILKTVKEELWLIEKVFDTEYKIASYYFWTLNGLIPRSHLMSNLLSTFHKNLFAFYAALELTRKGLFGSARPLMRTIFESLMISKFCSISRNKYLLQKWGDGETIYFTNSIVKNILFPQPAVFQDFWKIVCLYSHPTIFSQQISLNIKEERKELLLNFVFLKILFVCSYHLLSRHLINSRMRYYVDSYLQNIEKTMLKNLRKDIRNLFVLLKRDMSVDSKNLIKCYRSVWILR